MLEPGELEGRVWWGEVGVGVGWGGVGTCAETV